jgi:activator of the mannose operon, transcriptional antiterminator
VVKISGRHIKTILYLLEQKYPVSASRISKEIDVNINTLRKDIPQFADFLEENGLSLRARPRIGLKIDGPYEKIEGLKEKLTLLENKLFDRKGKVWYTAELLLSSERIPTIEDLCEFFDTSRPTTIRYIREARQWLSRRRIEVLGKPGSGYYIKGNEEDIRDAIVDSIRNFLEFEFPMVALEFAQGSLKHTLLGVFENTNLDAINKFMEKVQTDVKKRFVDEDLLNLAISVAVSIRRIEKHHRMDLGTRKVPEILRNPMSLSIRDSIHNLEEESQVMFTEEEICYLALKFIGARTQDVQDTAGIISTSDFRKTAEEIASLAEELLGLPINKEDEFVSMLARHLESAITKIKIGAKMKNPALEMLRREYRIAYNIAERASRMIERQLSLRIPDEETGYIAMYIAASLEGIGRPARRKVVAICSMGVASSKLLYYKLLGEIPEIQIVQARSIKELEDGGILQEVDLIVSTAPLSGLKIPYVVVSPFLRPEDKRAIEEILRVGKGRLTSRTTNESMLNEGLIFQQVGASSSTEAIILLGNALIGNGFARKGLLKGVLSREEEFPTGINTEVSIAVPHSGPEFTIRKGLAIATLKNPVKFHEMRDPEKSLDVRIVIMPVLTGKEEDGREFYEVMKKLTDSEVAEKLLQSRSPQAIMRTLMGWQFRK